MSSRTKKLVYCAAFIAISVILSYISGFFTLIRISMAPAIIMFAGAALGPLLGGVTGAAADLVTFLIKPTGTYFPGFSLTMALYGILAGLFFYKQREERYLNIGLKVTAIQTICSAILNTLWLSIMMGTDFTALLVTRLPNTYISCAIYIALMIILLKNRVRIMRGLPVPESK